MSEIIIDAKNATLGRLASYAAKKALQGEKVIIVNSEEAIISGRKEDILGKYLRLRGLGGSSLKGPKITKKSERIVKRAIRGMIGEHRSGRGKEAWRRIKCFDGLPEEYKDKKMIKSGKEIKNKRFIRLKELIKNLG